MFSRDSRPAESRYLTRKGAGPCALLLGLGLGLLHAAPALGGCPVDDPMCVCHTTTYSGASSVGTLYPRYKVLSVVYAPPGSSSSGSQSVVDYTEADTIKNGTSMDSSFKYQTSASLTMSSIGGQTSLTSSMDWAMSAGSSDSFILTNTKSETFTNAGPTKDGVNHDYDLIYVWVNPEVTVSVTPVTKHTCDAPPQTTNVVKYNLGTYRSDREVVIELYAGSLRSPPTIAMDATTKSDLASWGITSADYPAILAHDPFGNLGSKVPTSIDLNRFADVTNLNYQPIAPGAGKSCKETSLENRTTTSHSTSVTQIRSLGYTWSTGMTIPSIVKTQMASTSTWTWTDSLQATTSNDHTVAAKTMICRPSSSYTGYQSMRVMYDTEFMTFAYIPTSNAASRLVSGWVVDDDGLQLAGAEVVLAYGDETYRVLTDEDGEYVFYDVPEGEAALVVGDLGEEVEVWADEEAIVDFDSPDLDQVWTLNGDLGGRLDR